MKNIIYIVCLFLFTSLNGQDTLYRFYLIKTDTMIGVEHYDSDKEGNRILPLNKVFEYIRDFYQDIYIREDKPKIRKENKA